MTERTEPTRIELARHYEQALVIIDDLRTSNAELLAAIHAALAYVVSRGDLRENTEASGLQTLLRAAIAKAEGR